MPRSDENRQKEKAGLSLLICIKMILLGEAGLNKLHELINSLLLVGTTCDDADLGVAHDAEGKHAQKALGVDSALVLFHPDGRLELVSLLNEKVAGRA